MEEDNKNNNIDTPPAPEQQQIARINQGDHLDVNEMELWGIEPIVYWPHPNHGVMTIPYDYTEGASAARRDALLKTISDCAIVRPPTSSPT
jgi:hypothetical protein